MRTAMESLMRSKQTATEAAGRGAVTGSGTGARRRLPRSLYVAFLLLAGFSVSGAACGVSEYQMARDQVVRELNSQTPDLFDIGVNIAAMEKAYPGTTDDLTDQFNRLGGWRAAHAQLKVLTSGGTWTTWVTTWVTLGTNPDLNPGGPTFTGTTSPRGASGCAPGHTFIIGVGCV
jgi:hypothetical protein